MPIPKAPCFNYQAATSGKTKNYGLTPAEIRPIWEYAKKRYLDAGVSYEETIDALHRETGAPPRFFEEVFTGPKSGRVKNIDILRKEEDRRQAKLKAQQAIDRASYGAVAKTLYKVGTIPRAALTAFHGGVFPVTHAGGLLLRPTTWGIFLRGESVAWRSMSPAQYMQERLRLFSEPAFADWKGAGLRIGFGERPQGILAGLIKPGTWGDRAWMALERMRFDLAEQSLKRFKWSTPQEKLDIMKNLAEIANHATGVSSRSFGVITKGIFAPQLTMSKLERATIDPAKTIHTFARMMTGRGAEVSAGERAAAYTRLRNAIEFVGTTAAGLYLNDQLLQMAGSNQRINFTDWAKTDWLRFKTGYGTVLTSRGPEEFFRLYGQLAFIAASQDKRQIHGRNPWDAVKDAIGQMVMYKISPGIGTAGELALGVDIYGRPLPKVVQQMRHALSLGLLPEKLPTQQKPMLGLAEYLQTHAPIFWAGGSREFYEDLKERGLSEADQRAYLLASLSTAMEFLGFGSSPEPRSDVPPTKRGHGRGTAIISPPR